MEFLIKPIEENYKCSQCGKDIVWIYHSKSERDRDNKADNKTCKDCYENFFSGKWKLDKEYLVRLRKPYKESKTFFSYILFNQVVFLIGVKEEDDGEIKITEKIILNGREILSSKSRTKSCILLEETEINGNYMHKNRWKFY